jgi:putative oxidoreductase
MLEKVRGRLEKSEKTLQSVALLLVRLSVGIVFAQTGWGKLHNLEQIVSFFRELGIPAPELQAPFVSGLEFVGGCALILGLGSRLFAAPLIGTMLVAIVTAKASEVEAFTDVLGFIEWHYLVFFAVVVLCGPGRLSLDHLLGKRLFKPAVTPPAVAQPA